MAVVIRLELHTEEILEKLERNKKTALTAVGEQAREFIKECMVGGYPRPVYDTGTLYRDVQYKPSGDDAVDVGSTLDYAPYVHDGTYKMAGRAYIRDGILGNADSIQSTFESYISQGL